MFRVEVGAPDTFIGLTGYRSVYSGRVDDVLFSGTVDQMGLVLTVSRSVKNKNTIEEMRTSKKLITCYL